MRIWLCISFFSFLGLLAGRPAFSATQAVEYLCETGINFYRAHRFDDALMEFKKALMMDPANETAKAYIDNIFKQEMPAAAAKEEIVIAQVEQAPQIIIAKPEIIPPAPIQEKPILKAAITQEPIEKRMRGEIMNKALEELGKKGVEKEAVTEKRAQMEIAGARITGETQLSLGITQDDTIWNQANADLNERNFRMLSNTAYDRRTNTYDTRVYDRVRLNLDTDNAEGFNFHSNIIVDPWSFTGKSDKLTIAGAGGDSAEIQLKYWSNTRYTINETVFTLRNGDSFALPEIKVKDGNIERPVTISSAFNNNFTLPEIRIHREFQPLREFWMDYKQEGAHLRFFPIAYQDQALTFDDPLRLSNNHIWWEESPWLDRWLPGRRNSGANPVDFTRGEFDDSLSFFTRDSDGVRLTALRGFSFEFMPDERAYLTSTFASPKGLWQDYGTFDNIINATRLKYRLLDNLSLGSIYTYRAGLSEDNKRDVSNYVWGMDAGYEVLEGVKLSLEAAASRTHKDIASPGYASRSGGNAYNVSLIGTFPVKSLMDLKYGYSEIKPEEWNTFFTKYRFYAARMDEGFNPTLSTYRETRDDTFWSRHIHFRKPFEYFYSGLYLPTLKWEDIEPNRLGNGIDIGRSVLGFRLENSLWDKRAENLFDVRNVHEANGKFVENIAREEITYKVDDNLTAKVLGIYQELPKTKAGVDPFIFDSDTGIFLNNAAMVDGKNPTLKTGSLGMEYAFTEWLALSGIWERTNDYTLAYDNFPRGVLNSSTFATFSEYDKVLRKEDPFLYSQGLFPLPPYPFYNIFKTALKFDPFEKLEFYLDYTRNEFKGSGQIDDNMNHIGFEASYRPSEKIGIYLRYAYSRWNDINRMLSGLEKIYLGHHNLFAEFKYLPTPDDEFIMQYGESGRSPIATIVNDPFGGSLLTLDTRHILRAYYRRKF